MDMKKLNKIIIAVLLSIVISTGIWSGVAFALQAIYPPDDLSIDAVDVFQSVSELNDQMYIIKYDIEYTSQPDDDVSKTFLTRLLNGATTLASIQFYPFKDNGYNVGYGAIYLPAATAPTWNGVYTMEIRGNPSYTWLSDNASTSMQGALSDNASGFTDETAASNNATANDMNLLPWVPQVDDAYYFGANTTFSNMTLNLGTSGSWVGAGVWEYSAGPGFWKSLDSLYDTTENFTAIIGFRPVQFGIPGDWANVTVNAISAYWIRYRITAYTSTAIRPLGTQSWTGVGSFPNVSTSIFTWYSATSVADGNSALTEYLRSAAIDLGITWGDNLTEVVNGQNYLNQNGEDYFTNVISGLKDLCPDLFANVLIGVDFPERHLGGEYNLGGDTAGNSTYSSNWFGQSFNTTVAQSINGIWLKGYRVGNPGNVTVALRNESGGLPTGANLVSGSVNSSAMTTDSDGDWYEWTFDDDQVLGTGIEYAIVVSAPSGNATDYFVWRKNTTGAYTEGQASYSTDSGASWTAMAGEDFIFQTTVRNGWSGSLRNRLAARLIGTKFDMTNLGASFGLSRMWMTAIVWLIVSVLVAWGATRGAKSYKLGPMIMMFMFLFGGMTGFLYLEVSAMAALLSGVGGVYVTFYRTA